MAMNFQLKVNVTSDECAACHKIMKAKEMGTRLHCGGYICDSCGLACCPAYAAATEEETDSL